MWRSRSERRWSAALVAAACVAGGALAVPSAEATVGQADPSTTITVTGHGWGHGRGMGQWGAYGYATGAGWTSGQILGHFYGTTAPAPVNPQQPISVWLKALDGADLVVTSSSDFWVGHVKVSGGSGARITRDAGGQWVFWTRYNRCAGDSRGEWGPVLLDPTYVIRSDVASPGNDLGKLIAACTANGERNYRGQLKLVESGGLKVVNLVGVDDYVRGVVPRESPASWPAAPLEAQAVAARSYGLAEGGEGGTRFAWAKTCDDIFCQVYGGAGLNGSRLEQPSTDAAVAATAGEVLRYGDGRLARTEFSASSGGYTNGTPTCGTCAFPAVPDDGDFASPYHNWGTTLSASAVESTYGVGTLQGIEVVRRNGLGDGGGRSVDVTIWGSTRAVTVSGDSFRSAFALRSDWFFITPAGPEWFLRNSNTAGVADGSLAYGQRGDLTMLCDWNGDTFSTPGAVHNAVWSLRNSNFPPGDPDVVFSYGIPSDVPVCGDWNGDGVDTPGVFRAGAFYLRNQNSSGTATVAFSYGGPGDVPVVGDWNGDGIDTVGVYRSGGWYLTDTNQSGIASLVFGYGQPGDRPVVGDWNGDGVDTVGVVRSGAWYLRNAPRSGGVADVAAFGYGAPSDVPLAGDFDGNATSTPGVVRGL